MAYNQLRGTEVQDCPSIRVTQSDNCPSIRVRLTGGGGTKAVDPLDVNFYDYDGTCVAAYTAADFAALDAMPANPSHQGLTAQGWNWSLSDAKAYVAAYGKLNIGQQYITDDGKTRLYIQIATEGKMAPTLKWSQTVANGVTVDWGDGSATETAAGTGQKSVQHTYQAPGSYIITIEVTSGIATLGGGGTGASVLGPSDNPNKVYPNMVMKVELGEKVALANGAFAFCASMESVNIPDYFTKIEQNAFVNCASLRFVSVPDGVTECAQFAFSPCLSLDTVAFPKSVTTFGQYLFNNCGSLRSLTLPAYTSAGQYMVNTASSLAYVVLPEGITDIPASAFPSCGSLATVTIPSTVTSIDNSAFANCHCLAEVHCKATTPPTLGTNAFQSFPAAAKIYVPAASLATYQAASEWSTYASQMIGE